MKARSLMAISLLLSFIAMNANSINWNDQGSQTVDQMFTGDNRSLDTGPDYTGVVHSGSSSAESQDLSPVSSMIQGKIQVHRLLEMFNPPSREDQRQFQEGGLWNLIIVRRRRHR